MKIALIGAFGKTGQAIIEEATKRGHDVLAIGHKITLIITSTS
ncbi:hypothetical protein [Lactiplantibacillus mudanjiangensis]|uniref:Putative NADH-flavin reductase [Lactobacillus rhamnosus GG] n=1 Tax=Lactiplantibacillus mudanjiangensis TaxID=1296538 RepID=A0A660EA42_9LACO|nr:hypothetical protein [Lactiplantibacillus mudanjiangensis]VDG24734.1 putative NADH-flavin reductase [Lactobacillus rhamnosus GG] [Lactiplantibacillus mudanjiangensis]VDG29346.1 putative NADH-flavin reductase [Lactobacillus rhamnosus GG] [Lactiplantibacillus mudanjiangensis]